MLKGNHRGFTLIELITVIVCIGVLSFLALPKFFDLSEESRSASEEELVGSIRTGLQLIRAESMVQTGAIVYPDALDDAEVGPSSTENPFFANVLHEPYRGNKWQKESNIRYVGPAGNAYVYNSSSGLFEKQE